MQQHKTLIATNPLAELANRAVSHARTGQWDDAIHTNRELIAQSPGDVEAHNRLGKALSEVGKVKEAISAFQRSMDLRPGNPIATRNLERLKQLENADSTVAIVNRTAKANPAVFMAARGSAVLSELKKSAPPRILAKVTAGDRVTLESRGTDVTVTSPSGDYLGLLDARIARRVTRLTGGGNRYEATVAGFANQSVSVFVRESYRSQAQANITSFPPAIFGDNRTEDASLEDEVRPELFLDRRALRRDVVGEFDEEDNPREASRGGAKPCGRHTRPGAGRGAAVRGPLTGAAVQRKASHGPRQLTVAGPLHNASYRCDKRVDVLFVDRRGDVPSARWRQGEAFVQQADEHQTLECLVVGLH